MLTPGPLTAAFRCSTCLRTFRNPVPPLLKRRPPLKTFSLSLACGLCPRREASPRAPATDDDSRGGEASHWPSLSPSAANRGPNPTPPLYPFPSGSRRGGAGHVPFCLHPLSCWGPSSPGGAVSHQQTAAARKGGARRPPAPPNAALPSPHTHTHTHGRRQPPAALTVPWRAG